MGETRILSFEQPADFYYENALKLLDRMDYINALPHLRQAIEKDPGNTEYLLTYSEVLTEMAKYDESNVILLDMLKSGRVENECYFGLGCNFIGMNDFEKAHQSFEQYLMLDPNGEFAEDAQEFLQFIDDYSDPDNEFLTDVTQKTSYELANAGKRHLDMGEYKRAISLLLQVDDPTMLFAKNNLALSYFCDHQVDRAIEITREVLKQDRHNIHALCNMALFYGEKGDYYHLTEYLRRIDAEDPGQPEDLYKIAITFCELMRHERALDTFDDYLEMRPYDERATFFAAIAAYNQKKYTRSIEYLMRMIKMDPANTVAQYYCGFVKSVMEGEQAFALLEYKYGLPPEETRRRLEYLNSCFGQDIQTVRRRWEEDTDFSALVVWGREWGDMTLKTAIAGIIAEMRDDKAEQTLRRFLLQPNQPDAIKNHVFLLLKKMGAKEPYVAYVDGNVVEVKVSPVQDLRIEKKENEESNSDDE